MFTGAFVAGLLVAAPAAHAAFTGSAAATMTSGTHTMAAPAGNDISASCDQIGGSGKYRLKISVISYGAVPRANNYVLRMVSPSGAVTAIDLTSSSTGYDSGPVNGVARGTWKYSVEAQYKVPATTNVWSSTATPLAITC
ncbi:hypothetical protein ACS5PJ_19700 [Pseudarthrobacter sp. YS3]|uniref:hypothetical protein n=1 Tax=Pseudarthrobacter sp. YS3 TaxID=3453718 RepID=UPI003EE85F67